MFASLLQPVIQSFVPKRYKKNVNKTVSAVYVSAQVRARALVSQPHIRDSIRIIHNEMNLSTSNSVSAVFSLFSLFYYYCYFFFSPLKLFIHIYI